jgi:hypothetical protein
MTSVSVRLPKELVADARQAGEERYRNTSGQLSYWARLGQVLDAERDGLSRVREALTFQRNREDLSGPEREVFDELITAVYAALGDDSWDKFMDERRKRAPIVGYDENDRLVREHPDGRIEVLKE